MLEVTYMGIVIRILSLPFIFDVQSTFMGGALLELTYRHGRQNGMGGHRRVWYHTAHRLSQQNTLLQL